MPPRTYCAASAENVIKYFNEVLEPYARCWHEAVLAAAGFPFRPAVEVGNLSLVRRFVAAGLGVAPVPAVAFRTRRSAQGIKTYRLAGLPPVSYLRAIRAGVPLPPLAGKLLELVRS